MLKLQHNMVSILYTVKGMIASYFAQVEEGRFVEPLRRLAYAEHILKKVFSQTDCALRIVKILGALLKSGERKNSSRQNADVKRAWHEAYQALRQDFLFQNTQLIVYIPNRFPSVQCSSIELQEILRLLAANALQAMEDLHHEKRLVIRVQYAYATTEEPHAVITIADNGAGVPAERLDRLFQPFFTTKPEGIGNGLGLFMAHELVRRNKGKLTVSTYEGVGTAFSIEFKIHSTVKVPA